MKKRPERIGFARHLRRSSTDAERALWRRLSNKQLAGAKFRRQQPLGSYVVDFVCFEHGLVIEVDGGQHSWTKECDSLRTAWLQQRGYKV
ncbi:MAG: endonuclease domain-containing protein [Methylococcales bacterium]